MLWHFTDVFEVSFSSRKSCILSLWFFTIIKTVTGIKSHSSSTMVVARVRYLQGEIELSVLQDILLCLHFAAPPDKVEGLDQFLEAG